MSTSSGNATKGEKGKKFQSLKINLCAANKPTEPEQQQQHRSSIQRKQHGMTSLGRVPTARRPTNLPSEKAEHGGNDLSVNLVPSGGPGWGNKQSESSSTTTPSLSTNQPANATVNNVTTTGTSQQVPHAQLYPPISRMPPMPAQMGGHAPVHHGHSDVKTWAMMTHGGDSLAPNFLTPQSPLFHHEFPSLSSNSETSSAATHVTVTATQKPTANTTVDTQYGPGPSLRPQTEGSWIQGGSRPQNAMNPAVGSQSATAPAQARPLGTFPPPTGPDGARNNLGPSGVGVAQVGPPYSSSVPPQQNVIPPQFTGLMPSFMLRNSYPSGNFTPNFAAGPMKGSAPRPPYVPLAAPHSSAERFIQPANSGKRAYDDEDVKIRPIVKEEDLNHMASIGNDVGWAAHEDIDYNQKLKFSDDEDDSKGKDNRGKIRSRTQPVFKASDKPLEKKDAVEKELDSKNSKENMRDREKLYSADPRNSDMKNAWQMRRTIIPASTQSSARYQIPANGRFEEDDEAWQERRRQKKEEMDIIIQRAKERKEEEEKRFSEQQQAANLKLKKLEAAMEANQFGNKENKIPLGNERDLNMLPPWEKDKYQPIVSAGEESKKSHASTPVPVVKDASEFRELTQLVDKNFVKKEIKERENVQQIGFSRNFMPPRFQNRPANSASTGPTRSIISQNTQFSSKTTNFSITRLHRSSETDFQSDKDRDWKIEDGRKERDVERYSKDLFQERDYGYNHSHDQNHDIEYEKKFGKEYDSKSKYYNDKDETPVDSYNGNNFDREPNYSSKERKNSEGDKSKGYDVRRYSENENYEKEERYEHEKSRISTSRLPYPSFPESDNQERKRSREEVYETSKNMDKNYKKKDSSSREKDNDAFAAYKKEVEVKRDYEHESFKDERKSPSTYDDRLTRTDQHFHRESKESLRDEPFGIQDSRYMWTDDGDVDDKKLRKDHFRDDRGDRYSHAPRHVPRPITRAKLEAKELESDSKGVNLTPLVRSDKKIEVKKNDPDDNVTKDKSTKNENSEFLDRESESHIEVPSAWKRDDKQKLKDESKLIQSSVSANELSGAMKSDDSKTKEEKKENAAKTGSKDDQGDKSGEDKMSTKERRKNDHRIKDQRNWTRYGNYQGGNSYGGSRTNSKLHRSSNRGPPTKGSSRRGDSKYSESEYSDEVSVGSGREDRNSHSERDKNRSLKPKRYDRDDYRVDDRDYPVRGRSTRDYYYKAAPRGRNSGYRQAAGVGGGKRMDGYGPPSSRNPFGGIGHEDKRPSKSSKDSSNVGEQTAAEKKSEGKINKTTDRSWKKNIESQVESKVLSSSSASAQAVEANEESFATASEGSDSEDGCEIQKTKSSYGTTKRSPAVVATKPQRKYRSTSRKRNYENRRVGAAYPRKDSGSYATSGKRNAPPGSSGKPSVKKENDKYDDGVPAPSSRDDAKSSDKPSRDDPSGQNKKNLKPKNHSDSRKSTINTRPAMGVSSNNRKHNDIPPRMQSKVKSDGRPVDHRDSKNADLSSVHVRECGPPIPAPPPSGNAWDKPLTGALRTGSPSTQRPTVSNPGLTASVIGQEKSSNQISDHRPESAALSSDHPSNSASVEKVTTKVLENLDGSTPPVQTIIFENTNYKSSPADISSKSKYNSQLKGHRFDKDSKLDCMESNVSSFGNESSTSELTNNKHDSLQMALFTKNEDVNDMKLDFNFDSTEFSKLADDNGKPGKATLEITHAMNIDADLNFKIASVKKVWDGSLAEQYDDKYDGGITNTSTSFSPSFSSHGSDPNNVPSCYSHVDSSGHVQVDDVSGLSHGEVVFSPQIQGVSYGSSNCQTVVIKNDAAGSSSNVCKVKPQPQGCGTNIVNAAQSSVISTTLVSQPPPMSSPSYTFSCSTPQPNLSNGNVALPTLSFPASFNVPPMPSSPVLFNSSQTAPQTAGLYPTFQIDNSQVAARSTFGQYSATYGLSNAALGQTATPYNQGQSMYLPPPTGPPPELYQQQMPQFRIQPQPFANTQQITSPNTVLISSTTNSLMSPSIKPTNQQISAIGTKTAGFATAQTTPQLFMYDAATQLLANQSFIPSNPIIQRPASNVVNAGQLSAASNSFYSSASGAGQTGYYPGTNSALQPQTGAAIGLTAFTQSTNQSLNQIPNFNSQLTQQYRSAQQSYMKTGGNASTLTNEFASSKTLTIPNHDVLNPGFPPTNKRLPSGNKSLQGVPQGIPQHSMTQNAYSYQASNQMRNNGNANKASQYPHPIQRPVSQGNTNSNRANGGGSNSSNTSAAHRMTVRNNSHQLANSIQQPPSSAYYSTSSAYSSSKLDASQLDSKSESGTDAKLADSIKTISAKNASSDKNATSNE